MNSSKTPIVSIIIPVYNVQDFIEECIHSVLVQTYRNIEIILVDDCGSDNSIELAKALLSQQALQWKIIYHECNRGLSAARNSGVEHARGDYIFFLDSDDVLTSDAIHALVDKASEKHAEMIFGNFLEYREGILSAGLMTRQRDSNIEYNPLLAYAKKISQPCAWNRLINHDWYRRIGVKFIEGILHEDEPWSLSLALRSKKIDYVNQITYYYRQRIGSIMYSTNNQKKRIRSRLFILEHAYRELNQHFATAWPRECMLYYSEFQWALANDIHTLNEAEPQLRVVFSQVRIPFFNSPNVLIRLFFYMRIFIPQYLAYYLIVSLYKFIISIRTRIRKYI